jgi:Fe-S-cluster containining protein
VAAKNSSDEYGRCQRRAVIDAMRECNQCGKCCTNYGGGGGLSASAEEIDWWETARPDIARYVRDGKIWASPETGKILDHCPWLEKLPDQDKYTCRIYFDRPGDCRYYPVDIEQMLKDDCEMLQAHDLADPGKAQKKLDLLMSDSRPPVDSAR